MPYDVLLKNKSWRKGEWWEDICGDVVCLPKQLLYLLRLCFPKNSWTSACLWFVVNKSLFLLCFYVQFFAFLNNCTFIKPWDFLCHFLPQPFQGEEWGSSWVDVWQSVKANPPWGSGHRLIFWTVLSILITADGKGNRWCKLQRHFHRRIVNFTEHCQPWTFNKHQPW